MKKITLVLVSILLLTGCVTYNKCVSKYGTQRDTVRVPIVVVVRDTVRVVTPGDSLSGFVYDSPAYVDSLWNARNWFDTAKHVSKSGKLEVKFWKDKYNRQLRYSARMLRDTIEVVVHDTVRVVGDCPPGVLFESDKEVPWFRELWLKYQLFAAWALLVLLFALVFLNKIKSLFR